MRHTALTCTTIAIPCHSFWFKHTHTRFTKTIVRFSSPAQFSHIHTMVQICMYNVILIVVTRLMFEFEFESEFCLACLASFFPSHILAAYRTKCILHFKYWQWPRKCTHINCEHIMIWLFYRDKYKHTHWNAWLNGKAVCDKCTGTRTSRRGKKSHY